ncbi:MAG: alpha/beta hydrolase, partial [Burkholderiales bacterium]
AASLKGIGDRAHPFSAQASLATHVDNVHGPIEAEEMGEGLVLVVHSYGGNVITGVADVLRERIAHCVYLDAVVPPPGATRWRWADFNTPEDRQLRLAGVKDHGAGVALPAPPAQAFGVTAIDDVRWLQRRMRPMPLGTYLGEIALARGGSDGLPRTYVAAANPPYRPMQPVYDRVRVDPSWRYLTIDTGHDMMVTEPASLANLLLDL